MRLKGKFVNASIQNIHSYSWPDLVCKCIHLRKCNSQTQFFVISCYIFPPSVIEVHEIAEVSQSKFIFMTLLENRVYGLELITEKYEQKLFSICAYFNQFQSWKTLVRRILSNIYNTHFGSDINISSSCLCNHARVKTGI